MNQSYIYWEDIFFLSSSVSDGRLIHFSPALRRAPNKGRFEWWNFFPISIFKTLRKLTYSEVSICIKKSNFLKKQSYKSLPLFQPFNTFFFYNVWSFWFWIYTKGPGGAWCAWSWCQWLQLGWQDYDDPSGQYECHDKQQPFYIKSLSRNLGWECLFAAWKHKPCLLKKTRTILCMLKHKEINLIFIFNLYFNCRSGAMIWNLMMAY